MIAKKLKNFIGIYLFETGTLEIKKRKKKTTCEQRTMLREWDRLQQLNYNMSDVNDEISTGWRDLKKVVFFYKIRYVVKKKKKEFVFCKLHVLSMGLVTKTITKKKREVFKKKKSRHKQRK